MVLELLAEEVAKLKVCPSRTYGYGPKLLNNNPPAETGL
jgi:hypothetical protein